MNNNILKKSAFLIAMFALQACVGAIDSQSPANRGASLYDVETQRREDAKRVAPLVMGAAGLSIAGGDTSGAMLFGAAAAGAGHYYVNEDEMTDISPALSPYDQQAHDQALSKGLNGFYNGAPLSWDSEITGNQGHIIPLKSYVNVAGNGCRDYLSRHAINGQMFEKKHTACQLPSGIWVLLETK